MDLKWRNLCLWRKAFFLFGYIAYCLLYPMHQVAAFHQIVDLFISFISGMGFREHSLTSITLSPVTQQKLWHGHCKRKSDSQKDIYQLSSHYIPFILYYFAHLWHYQAGNLSLGCRKHWNTELILRCYGTVSIKTYRLCLFYITGNYSFNCFAILASAMLRVEGNSSAKALQIMFFHFWT